MFNDVFNIGSGDLTSINDIIITIEEVTNHKYDLNKLPARNFDVKSIFLDCSYAIKTFNWNPKCSLKAGIYRSWEWLKNNN